MSLHELNRIREHLKTVSDPISFLGNLFAHAPVGFAVWTADGRALLTNEAFMDLFGAEPPPEYNVLHDDVLAANGMLALFHKAFAGETVHVPTFWYDPRELKTIAVAQGQRVAISMTIFPLFKPTGEIDYVAATYKDETEITRANENLERLVQERTVQLSTANRELEAFSYSVAHDLRAPLRAMNGFSRILIDSHAEKLDAEGLDFLQRIQNNSILMGQLIDALLSLARVTRSDLQPAAIDLSALAQSVTQGLAASNPEQAVAIEIEPGMRAHIDPPLARTLLENLLQNAWKFTRKTAAPRVQVGVAQIDGKAAFFVRDNGAGFNMAYADKLFTPFQRLHSTSEFPGTGIGLATSNRIVQRHGGRLWGESQVGQGATFFFTLPAANTKS